MTFPGDAVLAALVLGGVLAFLVASAAALGPRRPFDPDPEE